MSATIVTKNGIELVRSLQRRYVFNQPYNKATFELIASQVCRMAPRYARMQERSCNDDPGSDATAAKWKAQEATLETTIRNRVAMFPFLANGHRLVPLFQGDPRGHTIKFIEQDNACTNVEERGDEIGVPGS